MSAGGATTPGQRPYNEDAYLVRDLSAAQERLGGIRVFMLASDGMGGHQAGDVASRVTVEVANSYVDSLLALAQQGPLSLDPALALREIAEHAHEAILREAAARGAGSMGATFVALFATDSQGWVAHVGDSRAYLIGESAPVRLTVDHSQVARMVAEGILTEQQADHHPQKNVIERALGFGAHQPELSAFRFERWDALVLETDGFSDTIDPVSVTRMAQSADSAQTAATLLAQEAQRAGSDDNATVVLWALDWDAFTQAGRLAPRRPATIQMSGAAAAEHRAAAASPRPRRPRSKAKMWVRLALVVLMLLVIAGVALLWVNATQDRSTVTPEKGSTTVPSAGSTSPGAVLSPAPPVPTDEQLKLAFALIDVDDLKRSDTPEAATLREDAHVHIKAALKSVYRRQPQPFRILEESPTWVYGRVQGGRANGSKTWYLVAYYDEEGVLGYGWARKADVDFQSEIAGGGQ